jgi:hypothetical protein
MKHRFTTSDGESHCERCGALEEDARNSRIGCEAPPEGNEHGYLGFALTPVEQALGISPAAKATALVTMWTPNAEFEERLATWNADVEARALARIERQTGKRPDGLR